MLPVTADEALHRPVISPLDVVRKKTGGELPCPAMVLDAFTALSLARAGLVRAVAYGHVVFEIIAGHGKIPPVLDRPLRGCGQLSVVRFLARARDKVGQTLPRSGYPLFVHVIIVAYYVSVLIHDMVFTGSAIVNLHTPSSEIKSAVLKGRSLRVIKNE